MSDITTSAHPNPVFEGSEKRVELRFKPDESGGECGSLREVPRAALDDLMALAECEIVSKISNDRFDAYVLSESSLFVYSTAWVLKTCGTTKLLSCLPKLLTIAAELGLRPAAVKYSRASFLFPEQQPPLYQSFESEADFLRASIGALAHHATTAVLGAAAPGSMQWHVWQADDSPAVASRAPSLSAATSCSDGASDGDAGGSASCSATSTALSDNSVSDSSSAAFPTPDVADAAQPVCTLEMCMTGLAAAASAQFVRGAEFVSSAQTTEDTGIRALVPAALIDDFVFEPCGYSMNGIVDGAFVTIHVTPEPDCSYASCEFHGFSPKVVRPGKMAAAVAAIFEPEKLTVAYSASAPLRAEPDWCDEPLAVDGYRSAATPVDACLFPSGGAVRFHSLVSDRRDPP